MTTQPPEVPFETWLAELTALLKQRGYQQAPDAESWKPYWKDGYTPKQASDEDATYEH